MGSLSFGAMGVLTKGGIMFKQVFMNERGGNCGFGGAEPEGTIMSGEGLRSSCRMVGALTASMPRMLVAGLLAAFVAVALLAVAPIADPAAHQAQATPKPHDFTFTHSAYRTNGKSAAYWEVRNRSAATAIVYKARIVGNKLYVTGTMTHNGKKITCKNKAFKLTSKTKYYKHVGNGVFYDW